jgi:hypothetical protein
VKYYVKSKQNILFSPGMNLDARIAGSDSTHLLLLNNDTRFIDLLCLQKVLSVHKHGVTGFRIIRQGKAILSDGFFFLIDRNIFWELGGLNEQYKWIGSLSQLQARALHNGYNVQAVEDYKNLLVHVGGRGGNAFKVVQRPDISTIESFFSNAPPVTIIPKII